VKENHHSIFGEYRFVQLNPKFLHTVKPSVLAWNGKRIWVDSWHENYALRELFPNDERVGWCPDIFCDLPESELLTLPQIKAQNRAKSGREKGNLKGEEV